MINIKFRNTLTKEKEIFLPSDMKKIGLYVCGPTVYDVPHIGNARAVVVYDILYRLLCHFYKKENIIYVRNITDVDDKINIAAKKRNITINELTSEITKIFHDNMKPLNCLSPNIEPKATDHIKEMIEIIEILLERKIAYIGKNQSVYFNVSKYPDYGKLAGRNIEELKAGARLEIDEEKINQEDFVLWKKAVIDDDPSSIFDSPWCKGRPGWHIECSAMSIKYLGQDFDIHGGGADLMFPHHTNEIAQTCCAFPKSKFAKYWLHNGFVTVDGEKMSKSLGNFITVNQLLEQGIKGEYIRYGLLSTIYRKPLDWNDKLALDAKKNLDKIYNIISNSKYKLIEPIEDEEFLSIISDDLNTPKSLVYLTSLINKIKKNDNPDNIKIFAKIKFIANILGLLQSEPDKWLEKDFKLSKEIEEKIKLREEARKKKNWLLADEIREEIEKEGFTIEDGTGKIIKK